MTITSFDIEAHVQRLTQDGYTSIEDFADAATLAQARQALAPHLGSHHGRNSFEGFATERVYTLVARGAVFERLTEEPRLLALLDRFLQPGYLLTASQAIWEAMAAAGDATGWANMVHAALEGADVIRL